MIRPAPSLDDIIETMARVIEREALGEGQFLAQIGTLLPADAARAAIEATKRAAIKLAAREAVRAGR